MIQINNVSKAYNEKLVLKKISFNVGKNEIVAIVGPNGCGKSTLLKIIANLEPRNGGEIIHARNSARAGFIFQDHRNSLFPWKTVEQNICFALKQRHKDSRERENKMRGIMDKMNLAEHKDKYPYELSGGMSQLTALAKAVALEPDYFLLDEPFSALDYHTALALQSHFLRLWREIQKPAIIATHSLEEAVLLSDRIIILSRSPAEIVEIIENKLPRPREILHLTLPLAHVIKDKLIKTMRGFIV